VFCQTSLIAELFDRQVPELIFSKYDVTLQPRSAWVLRHLYVIFLFGVLRISFVVSLSPSWRELRSTRLSLCRYRQLFVTSSPVRIFVAEVSDCYKYWRKRAMKRRETKGSFLEIVAKFLNLRQILKEEWH